MRPMVNLSLEADTLFGRMGEISAGMNRAGFAVKGEQIRDSLWNPKGIIGFNRLRLKTPDLALPVIMAKTAVTVGNRKIELKNDDFDYEQINKKIKKIKPKVVYIQRSKGYTSRKALSIEKIKTVCAFVKERFPKCFILVDNCYGEFVETKEPCEVGADVVMGSLIKNAGGGLAPTGGYIVGKSDAIDIISKRFTCPSLGTEVGSYENSYRMFYQGLFMAPHTVCQAVKGSLLIGKVMELKGYTAIPSTDEENSDIVRSIVFNDEKKLVAFVQTIQKYSPVDSFALPMPWDMPGYNDQVIMAAGTFVAGSSIELSCDGPIRAPYVAYFQGGLTYEHIKMVAEKILEIL